MNLFTGTEATERPTLVIDIPLPQAALSPNGGRGWRARVTAKKAHRKEVAEVMETALPEGYAPGPVELHCEWFMGLTDDERTLRIAKQRGQRSVKGIRRAEAIRYRPNDVQNANSSLKAAVDAMAAAGLVPDDSHKWVQWGRQTLHRTEKEHRGLALVRITVKPLEVA